MEMTRKNGLPRPSYKAKERVKRVVWAVLRSVFVEKTQGYGLRNVDERIRLLFGEAYGIRIEGTEDGTLCVITIPQRREEDL